MDKKINVEDAEATIILTIDGQAYLVAMDKDKYETLSTLIKVSAAHLVPAGRTSEELYNFLMEGAKGFDNRSN